VPYGDFRVLIYEINDVLNTDVKDELANVMSDNVFEKLCTQLNATETRFPRTNLLMVFKVGSI